VFFSIGCNGLFDSGEFLLNGIDVQLEGLCYLLTKGHQNFLFKIGNGGNGSIGVDCFCTVVQHITNGIQIMCFFSYKWMQCLAGHCLVFVWWLLYMIQ